MTFKFFRFNRKTDVQDVEPKVAHAVVPEAAAVALADTKTTSEHSSKIEESEEQSVVTTEHPDKLEPNSFGQMETIKATREDVIAAYKIFLGRLPESMEAVDPRVGVATSAILVDFLISKEFLDQPSKSQLILAVAKKILDERKQSASSDEVKTAEAESK